MYKFRYSIVVFVCLFQWASSAARAQSQSADTSIAGLYVLLARVESHPMIASGKSQIEAARRRIAQKSALANPMLMLGVLNLPTNSFSLSDDPMTSKMIGISQMFPYPGKLKFEGEIAAQDTLTSEDDLDEERNMLARDAKLAYFDLYHLERAVSVNEVHTHSLDDLIRLAQAKLATGNSSQSQILNLKLEHARIEADIIEEETMIRERIADLEQVSGSDSGYSVTVDLGLPLFRFSLEGLDSIARKNRPSLRKFLAQEQQYRLMYERSDLDKYPDFQLSLSYMQRNAISATSQMNPANFPGAALAGAIPSAMVQSDMVSATVSIELPFNFSGKRTEALAEAEAMRTMREEEESAAEREIHASLATALAKLDGTMREYLLLRDDIYPTVQQVVQSSITNYTYGNTSIDEAIRTQLDLFHQEHDRYRLEAEYNSAIATIEYLTGSTLVAYTSTSNWK